MEGAIYAGVDFFAGYPITPSTEIAELLAARLPEKGGKFIQMEDEIASMCAIIGASLTGKKVMTATSGPGFFLKAGGYRLCLYDGDPLRHRQCAAGRPVNRQSDPCQPGGYQPGPLGHPRRSFDHRPDGLQSPGRLYHDGRCLQYGRDLPHPRCAAL